MTTTYIGIDTGVHTGVAVVRNGVILECLTVPIHKAMALVHHYAHECNDLVVVFEDARQRKWIPREKSYSEMKGRTMGAGSVRRDANIWEDYLRDLGCQYIAQAPQKGQTKWSADYFAKVTGYKGRTSEHARDAALLVYGKSI